ncbi:MAG: hypothetical protein ACRD6N_15125, partial [Pyrinomonadaceae bacterium]
MSNNREASSVESLTALKRVACVLALVLFVVFPAYAQQTNDEVQKQIQELKQQYEQTTRDLQERIATLEQQLKKVSDSPQSAPKKEGDLSAVELAVQD